MQTPIILVRDFDEADNNLKQAKLDENRIVFYSAAFNVCEPAEEKEYFDYRNAHTRSKIMAKLGDADPSDYRP